MRVATALALSAALLSSAPPLLSQYQDHAGLDREMSELARAHADRAELVTIATSPGGLSVKALRVGPAGQPSLLVVAGANGPDLIGSTIALTSARSMLESSTAPTHTVWFVPRLNPDAAEAMFGKPAWERTANAEKAGADDDHDQLVDEDGPDDLNGDGVITRMLVVDPAGSLIADSLDPRLFRRASVADGEVGKYREFSEGRDNDGDELWNEDGPGGTNVNRNFSYNYPHHGSEAGLDPFAAPEARGLAEFVIAHPEVSAVFVLGPQDNLIDPWKHGPNQGIMREDGTRAQEGTSQGGPLHSIMSQDQSTFADMSRIYKAATGLDKGPKSASLAGDVLSWAYYGFGRWSFGTRGWWVPKAPADSGRKAGKGGTNGKDPLADDRNALAWFESQGVDAFVPWATAAGVEYKGQPVQVGGFKPGALINPPVGAELDSAVARNGRFIDELAGMLPRLSLDNVTAKQVGTGVYRVSADLVNGGGLPTTTSLAARLRRPRQIHVVLDTAGVTILSGQPKQQVGPISANRRETLTWTVAARAGTTLKLQAGSPTTGTATQNIPLR